MGTIKFIRALSASEFLVTKSSSNNSIKRDRSIACLLIYLSCAQVKSSIVAGVDLKDQKDNAAAKGA
jgi:hypothetical protein